LTPAERAAEAAKMKTRLESETGCYSPVCNVEVTLRLEDGRRLEEAVDPPSSTSSTARQLSEATTYTVEIIITYPSSDSTVAAAVSSVTSQSAAELTTTLSAAVPDITVLSAPVVTTTTETVLVLVSAPSPPPPSPPPPGPPPTPPPMCECDVVHGAASLFDPCLKIEAGVRHCYPSAGGCPADMTDCISVYDCKNKMRNKKCDKKKNKGFCDLSSAKCTRNRGKCEKIRNKKCKLSCGNCSS